MEYEVRHIAQEELEAFRRCLGLAFGHDYDPEHLERGRKIFEFDRNMAAFDGGNIVGTCGIFSTEMAVPGGNLPVAAVTMVTVAPTHRRRGVASGLMRRQLEHVRERGESVAILWASESSIYGRFGYGVAIEMEVTHIPRVHSARRTDLARPGGAVRLLSENEARALLPDLHESIRRQFPGELRRTPPWWDVRIFSDPKEFRDGFTANHYLLYEGAAGPEGFARYRIKAAWDEWQPKGVVRVGDFFAATADATVALWDYLFGIDLIETIDMEVGGTPDPVIAMLADPRRAKRSRTDAIWLRIVDVEAALSGRLLGCEGRLVLEVEDAFLDGVGGTFELEGGPTGAVCRRTTASADVRLDIESLGTLFLGAGNLDQLARVGRVTGTAESLARAQAMLGWWRAPHCQEHF